MGWYERALLLAAIAGALGGLVGCIVVLRRRVFFAQALTHATFPGAVAAAALGLPIVLGAALAGLLLVPLLLGLARAGRQGQQVASAVVLTGGFAIGAALPALHPGVPLQPERYLFGAVLLSGPGELLLAAGVLLLAALVIGFGGRALVHSAFDPIGYRAAGRSIVLADALALGLTVLAVVALLPATGAILTIALLAGPATAAQALVRSSTALQLLSPLIGAAVAVAGVLLSAWLSLSAGAAIALCSAAVAFAALGWRRFSPNGRLRPWPPARYGGGAVGPAAAIDAARG